MNEERFKIECENLGIIIDNKIMQQLLEYKDLLIEWNKKFNLTTIIKDEDILLKHFYDSICLVQASDFNNKKICDFGTGAGFPGMVLAIIFNNSEITLLESNGKKIIFLNEVKNRLKLKNVTIINKRVEEFGKNNRELFDIVTCRAVSNLKIILELSISLLKINGLFIPLKSNIDEELNNSMLKSKLLGYKFIDNISYKLPIENSNRNILIFKKTTITDLKYPRNYNIIKRECE